MSWTVGEEGPLYKRADMKLYKEPEMGMKGYEQDILEARFADQNFLWA
jgi:hypothetical protein